jgi:DNA adenine methylase
VNVASKVNIENKILNDKHPYLIAMYHALQQGWIPPDIITEEDYHTSKQNQDIEPHLAGFIGFACSFAGKYWGGYARDTKGLNSGNYALRGKNSILNKMTTLMNATFTCNDFINLDYNNCLIYCDPPYLDTTSYYKQILGIFPYNKFTNWVQEQSKNNIVLISEYKHNVPEESNILLEIPSTTSIRDKVGNVIITTEVLYTYNDLSNIMDIVDSTPTSNPNKSKVS